MGTTLGQPHPTTTIMRATASVLLAVDSEATMESARLMPTPSDKWLTVFPWPMLMPPDTLTMLVLSPESATLVTATATEQESTTGSARLRLTLSGRWPTGAPEESSLVLTTATDGLLATEPLETVESATDSMDEMNIFQTENISHTGTF